MSAPKRVLILGGTTEARRLAMRLSSVPGCEVLLSLAGVTREPADQGVPTRRGGFGGADGLAAFLREGRIALLVVATHPFAARIAHNAGLAAAATGLPAFALRRPGWLPQAGDRWQRVPDLASAVAALGREPRRVLAAIGRKESEALLGAPWHRYVVRSIEPLPETVTRGLPKLLAIEARGPFALDDEIALFRRHAIERVLCKDSGGTASQAKLHAARELGLGVVMVDRPAGGALPALESVEAAEAEARRRIG